MGCLPCILQGTTCHFELVSCATTIAIGSEYMHSRTHTVPWGLLLCELKHALAAWSMATKCVSASWSLFSTNYARVIFGGNLLAFRAFTSWSKKATNFRECFSKVFSRLFLLLLTCVFFGLSPGNRVLGTLLSLTWHLLVISLRFRHLAVELRSKCAQI